MRAVGFFRSYSLYFKRGELTSLWATFGAFLYAVIIVVTPWDILQGAELVDRASYLNNLAVNLPVWEIYADQGWIFIALQEFLWDFIIRSFSWLSGSDNAALSMVTFFLSYVISRFVLIRSTSLITFILLLNPVLIELVSSQLRLALAFSLILIFYNRGGYLFRVGVLLMVMLIHTASILIIAVLWYAQFITRAFRGQSAAFFIVAIVVPVLIFAGLLGPGRELVLGAIGDRRAEYVVDAVGVGFTSVWILYLTVALYHGKKSFESSSTVVAFFFVLLFLLLNAMGAYGLRFLTVAYPHFIVSTNYFNGYYKILFLLVFLNFQLLQWLYFIKIL